MMRLNKKKKINLVLRNTNQKKLNNFFTKDGKYKFR